MAAKSVDECGCPGCYDVVEAALDMGELYLTCGECGRIVDAKREECFASMREYIELTEAGWRG